MKQNGAVLLITVVVLALLASLSQLHMSTILMNEKSTFNMMQYYRSEQYANRGLADAIRSVMDCELNRKSTYSDEIGNYAYTIEDHIQENLYKVTSVGTVLDTFTNTQQMVFSFDTKQFNPNNGWGNGDQDAPGNSLNNNNAENSTNGKEAPKGIQKKKEKDKNNNSCKQVSVEILYWTEL